jgi:hypothetical protein
MELELVDMFDLSGSPPGFAQPSLEMFEIFPTLYLLGNTVYFKSDCKDTTGLDRVILNAEMYTDDALKQAIAAFEEK